MPLKVRKPLTPGQRGLVLQTTDDITQRKPKKSLVKPVKKTGGRNSTKNVIGLSILRGITLVFWERLRLLNMTQIDPLGLH